MAGVGGFLSLGRAAKSSESTSGLALPAEQPNDAMTVFIGGVLLLGSGAMVSYTYAAQAGLRGAAAVMWALALAVVGGLVGFLFGIPKVLQAGRPQALPTAAAASGPAADGGSTGYEQRVNTNLEDISDWLTKIVVGLGLVNLKTIVPQLDGLAARVGRSLNGGAEGHESFGLALVLFFIIGGFLFTYLLTRLYLQGALVRAERGLSSEMLQLRHELTSAETAKQVLQATAEAQQRSTTGSGGGAPIDDELRELARQYMTVSVADYGQRLAAKNQLAAAMYRHVVEKGISRDALAAAEDEGLSMALATAAHAAPSAGDFDRLMRIAPGVTRLHVKYRIVLALEEMFRRRLCSASDKSQALAMLRSFQKDADPPLERAIQSALQIVGGA